MTHLLRFEDLLNNPSIYLIITQQKLSIKPSFTPFYSDKKVLFNCFETDKQIKS